MKKFNVMFKETVIAEKTTYKEAVAFIQDLIKHFGYPKHGRYYVVSVA